MERLPIDRRKVLRFLGAGALVVAGCRGRRKSIVVGSKNFTEQYLLGELLAQQIEAHTPLQVDRRLNLGGTFVCHQALVAGQLDLYAEYTGTALTAVLGASASVVVVSATVVGDRDVIVDCSSVVVDSALTSKVVAVASEVGAPGSPPTAKAIARIAPPTMIKTL